MKTLTEPLWQYLRPKRLEDFIGCEREFKALHDIHRGVVLFFGPWGCGKTSAARAFASAEVGKPMPLDGSAYEVDGVAAGHWYAENFDVEKLTEKVMPIFGITRSILILDEAHLFTEKQQTAIQYYIESERTRDKLVCLCTTEPQKILRPLMSRCTYKIELGPLEGDNRLALAEKGWKELGMDSPLPGAALIAEFDRRTPNDPDHAISGRAILNAVENIAQGIAVGSAVRKALM
jgi:replication-associated recombination protein RarA